MRRAAILALCLLYAAPFCLTQIRADDKPLRKLPGGENTPASQPTSTPGFIIGVFSQPADSFAQWKARGINTLVGYESQNGRVPIDDWSGLAVDRGLFFIRAPAPHITDDLEEGYLLAWMHADEPDVQKPPTNPSVLAHEYNDWKAVSKPGVAKTGKDIPVYVNFSGGDVLFKKQPRDLYEKYMAASDWVGNDFYPVTGWGHPDWLMNVGQIVDLLRDWSHNKPQFACIECSAQRLPWTPKDTPGPTPDQFRAEVWDAVIHGVKGIIYFPQQIGYGFQYDAIPPNVAIELMKQNRRLTGLADVLKTEANPASFKVEAKDDLEVGWRVADHKAYLFALNTTAKPIQNARLKLKDVSATYAIVQGEEDRPIKIEDGKITDDYDAYQVHVYVIKLP